MTSNPQPDRISDAGVDVWQISQASVLVKVGDVLPQLVRQHPVFALVRALVSLGFRSICLCGAADYFDDLDDVSMGANLVQHPGMWLNDSIARSAPDADVIVNIANDVDSVSLCARLGNVRSCPCFQVMWGDSWVAISRKMVSAAELGVLSVSVMSGRTPLGPIGRIASGLALQEVLMFAGNVDFAAPLETTVIYNAAAEDRTSTLSDCPWKTKPVQNSIVDLIGAGGIGIHAAEALAPMLGDDCLLRIYDNDVVGMENIPLQVPYRISDIGRPKAIVIAERLSLINPNLKIQPLVVTYQDRPDGLSKPSVRLVCGDNFAIRKFANDLSIADGVPLVEAGSSPLGSQQRTYFPGLTACLEHRIRNLAKKVAVENEPASCSASRALTLPGTNAIVGGILATEALKAIEPEGFGLPASGTITYDARVPQRFGVLDVLAACEHKGHL